MSEQVQYKAIIFDIDGTAIPGTFDAMPSAAVTESIRGAQAHSELRLCAATGRPTRYALPVFQALGLIDPCAIAGGTQIVNPTTGELLWHVCIEEPDVAKVLNICTPFNYRTALIHGADETVGLAGQLAARPDVNVMYVLDCSKADAAIIMEATTHLPGVTAADVSSWNQKDVDIHITHANATKEHAVTKILEMLGIFKEATIAVGDSNNDIHLFRAVGRKIAMSNATALLKSQADEICASVDDDGLADVIKKYATMSR